MRQAVPGFVQAEAADQPLLIEVLSVRHARMETVPVEIIHLVDIDGTGQHALQQTHPGRPRLAGQQPHNFARRNIPLLPQSVGNLAFQEEAVGEHLVVRYARQTDILNRMAKGPMPQIVKHRRDQKHLRVMRRHRGGKACVEGEPLEIQQRHPINAQGVFEPSVVGGGIDQRNQTQLADAGEPAKVLGVDDLTDARRKRDVESRGEYESGAAARQAPESPGCCRLHPWKHTPRRGTDISRFEERT